ncbi:MAG: hypothetical protein ACSHWY_05790 [Octadecabacter sp.]
MYFMWAVPVFAQDALFLEDVDLLIGGFEDAVAGEYVIPYQFSTAHRDILEESARNFPLPFQEYLNLVSDAYVQVSAENELISFDVARDDAAYGVDALGGWAVFPYAMQEKHISGSIRAPQCGVLVVFQDAFQGDTFTFLTVISDPSSRDDAIGAIPRIANMIDGANIAC